MPPLLSRFRRFARDVQGDIWPTPELAVLHELERRASREPRRTRGEVSLAPYRFEYADAISAWPQWDEIFVHGALSFKSSTSAPRILDCGANIGLASIYFKRQYPDARVTAFEADPALASICRRNLGSCGYDDVELMDAAVWIATGPLEFVCEGADSGAIAAIEPSVNGPRTAVPAVRLSDWLQEPIDLLKLDVEGAELPILEDCRDRLHNVRAMTIDLHEFNPGHRQTGAVFELLSSAGFQFDMRDLVPLPWRSGQVSSPFTNATSAWVATVRAWR